MTLARAHASLTMISQKNGGKYKFRQTIDLMVTLLSPTEYVVFVQSWIGQPEEEQEKNGQTKEEKSDQY